MPQAFVTHENESSIDEIQLEPLQVMESVTMSRQQSAAAPQFTLRAVAVGLILGILLTFSNIFLGLQTGWVMLGCGISAFAGFAIFKSASNMLAFPFSPAENVLVQTVASSVGAMTIGCGFVGVVPALDLLLAPDETPDGRTGLHMPLSKWIIWALGIAFFGVIFTIPLRKEVILRQKLRFPTGTATALLISVLHGTQMKKRDSVTVQAVVNHDSATDASDEDQSLLEHDSMTEVERVTKISSEDAVDYRSNIRLLALTFLISAIITVVSYFVPQIGSLPIFGQYLSTEWMWSISLIPAFIGQGIIMGPVVSTNQLIGVVVGFGILSPLATSKGWAHGPIRNWETGSRGWIVWISLAIVLSDSIVNLGWMVLRPLINMARIHFTNKQSYQAVNKHPKSDESDDDAPPEQLISTRNTIIGLILAVLICIFATRHTFAEFISIPLTLLALVLAMLLSVMGVQALGTTDINPVSGISKITQLIFAFVIPSSLGKQAVITNLVAGAMAESGALQAADLMQDLKTGHLIGASPAAQIYGQLIGSAVGAVVSALVYKLYITANTIPGGIFQIPMAYLWLFTARLATGGQLPEKTIEFASVSGVLFGLNAGVKILAQGKAWGRYLPSGIAIGMGMYNSPKFALGNAVGGFISWYWCNYKKNDETRIVIIATAMVLGTGVASIINLILSIMNIPHL